MEETSNGNKPYTTVCHLQEKEAVPNVTQRSDADTYNFIKVESIKEEPADDETGVYTIIKQEDPLEITSSDTSVAKEEEEEGTFCTLIKEELNQDECYQEQLSHELSPQPSVEPSQEKTNTLLIQSDKLAATPSASCASGSRIIIPPSLCPNVMTVQPGYTNVLTVLTPGVTGAAAPLTTSNPVVQNKNIPTVLLYEDFLRMQLVQSPVSSGIGGFKPVLPIPSGQRCLVLVWLCGVGVCREVQQSHACATTIIGAKGAQTLLHTPTTFKPYKPIAPKPSADGETTTVPASHPAVKNIEMPSTSVPLRRCGRGWRKGIKRIKKNIETKGPDFRKILPRRPPIRSFLNVREQKLVNGVEVKVLDYNATGEEALPVEKGEEESENGKPIRTEGPKIEVINEEMIQIEVNVTDDAMKNVRILDTSKDHNTEKSVADTVGNNKNNNDTPEIHQFKNGLSLSTSRRKHSRVRALDFNSPLKGTLKRPNTSPKESCKWTPRRNFMRNAKQSVLFKSPTSSKYKNKIVAGEITKQQNLSVVRKSKELVTVWIKEETDVHTPADEMPRKEALIGERSLLPSVVTMSPSTKLCDNRSQINGVEFILSSASKETSTRSWDADLRELAKGECNNPSPPSEKLLLEKKKL